MASINIPTPIETEKHALAGLFNDTSTLSEVESFVKESDFYNKIHQTIYLVLKNMILANERVDAVLLANKISDLGIKSYGELSIFEYVEMISYSKPDKESTIAAFKEIIGYRIRRDALEKLRQMATMVQKPEGSSIVKLLGDLDKTYGSWSRDVIKGHERNQIEICSGIEELIEGRRNNPPNDGDMLYGPFDTVNAQIGSLSQPSNITVIGARSGNCKSAISLFYQAYLALKYGYEILLCDNGEMTPTDIRFRLVSMLTEGRVPMHALMTGTWANNEEYSKLTRAAIAKAKTIKIHYEQVSGLKSSDIIRLLRSYSYKIGKGKIFLPCFDYLKAMEGEGKNDSEWAALGKFIQDIKTFITDEIPLPFWTSIQLNRSGINTNKKDSEINDHEGSFGLSDRVLQQSSHSILLRYKITSEIEEEGGEFGNMKMHFLKTRSLGRDYKLANMPVKLPSGKYARNHFNLSHDSFFFKELGDLNYMTQKMKCKYNLNRSKSSNVDEDSSII